MRLWSDEAGQRRDLKHPDVRVATLSLIGKIRFSNHACRVKYALGMWVPSVISQKQKPLGRFR